MWNVQALIVALCPDLQDEWQNNAQNPSPSSGRRLAINVN